MQLQYDLGAVHASVAVEFNEINNNVYCKPEHADPSLHSVNAVIGLNEFDYNTDRRIPACIRAV